MDNLTRSTRSTPIADLAGSQGPIVAPRGLAALSGLCFRTSRNAARIATIRDHRVGICCALAATAIAVIVFITMAIGPSRIMAPWDVFTLLEGGWRLANGQIPSADFHNPIGPLTYWLIAIGMQIEGASLKAFVDGNVIFIAAIATWSMAIFFRKLPPGFALLLTMFIAMLLAATRPLGYEPSVNTYAMIYNRYGWALASLLMIQLFVEDRDGARHPPLFDSLSSGVLLGLIFFDKISFFVFGCGALALALLLRPDLRRWAGLTVVGFVLVCVGFHLALGIGLADYARDILRAAHSQSRDQRIVFLVNSIEANVVQGLLIGGIWVLGVALPAIRDKANWRYAIRATMVLAFVLGSALGITAGDAPEGSDVPFFLIAGVIVLDGWRRLAFPSQRDAIVRKSATYLCASLIVVVVFFGGIFSKDALSLSNSYAWKADHPFGAAPSQHIDAQPLADFVIPETSHWNTAYAVASDVPSRINEALAMLRDHITPQSRVLTLAVTDPFSFALGLVPAKDAPLWWDLNFSFDRAHHLPPEEVFSEADYVIYPLHVSGQRGCCWLTVKGLLDLYGDFLQRHYVEVDRSANWVLMARRG